MQELGEDFLKRYNVKLGFMSFFLKAATMALSEFPAVNSVIDGTDIVRRNFVDISVAVATPTGLLVPVLRNCQNMKFHDFELVRIEICRDWLTWPRRAKKERSPLRTCKAEHSLSPTEAPSAHWWAPPSSIPLRVLSSACIPSSIVPSSAETRLLPGPWCTSPSPTTIVYLTERTPSSSLSASRP